MYGSIYLVVKDFCKSLDFYEKLFDMKVSARNEDRFAIFNTEGLNLCLMNGFYDEKHPERLTTKGPRFEEYDNTGRIARDSNSKKIFINLGVDDLDKEYKRILNLKLTEKITPIRYLCVFSPYWFFTLEDPDGNPIEIAGPSKCELSDQ